MVVDRSIGVIVVLCHLWCHPSGSSLVEVSLDRPWIVVVLYHLWCHPFDGTCVMGVLVSFLGSFVASLGSFVDMGYRNRMGRCFML